MKVLQISSLLQKDAESIIYNYGEPSNNMYLILKGTANICIQGGSSGKESLVVKNLRDGDHFGDTTKQTLGSERTESCICLSKSLLLEIPNNLVQDIISDMINSKLKEDIMAMKKTVYFKVNSINNLFRTLKHPIFTTFCET